jgi:hypothetical protein
VILRADCRRSPPLDHELLKEILLLLEEQLGRGCFAEARDILSAAHDISPDRQLSASSET